MDRLDIKLGLDIGYLVGCQVWAEIFWFTHRVFICRFGFTQNPENPTIGSLRSGPKICILPRPYLFGNFLTPERKNFVVAPKIELPQALALLLWFRCVQIVFEELISITRATIYCDEFKLYKLCVNRDRKNALIPYHRPTLHVFKNFSFYAILMSHVTISWILMSPNRHI